MPSTRRSSISSQPDKLSPIPTVELCYPRGCQDGIVRNEFTFETKRRDLGFPRHFSFFGLTYSIYLCKRKQIVLCGGFVHYRYYSRTRESLLSRILCIVHHTFAICHRCIVDSTTQPVFLPRSHAICYHLS